MSEFNKMQLLKRRFFAMRNGVIADTLRRGGSPFKVIFGLNLPQLVDISREFGPDREMACRLWADVRTRESLLLAPMLYPPEEMESERAVQWLRESPVAEVTDVLCHRLLRHLPGAMEIASTVARDNSDMARYGALRLMMNLLTQSNADTIRTVANCELERGCGGTAGICNRLIDEIEFLTAG